MDDMIGILPNARMSPRLINGVIKWYAGDTFDLQLTIELMDQDGVGVEINDTDTVEVIFYDKNRCAVKTFSFTNIIDNTITLQFDETASKLFPCGEYTYDIYYIGGRRVTLANENRVVVE